MSEQAKEWSEMSQQQQDEIKARLMAAVDTVAQVINADAVVLGYRQRLERASAVHYPQR